MPKHLIKYFLFRILILLATIFTAFTITFVILKIMPIDIVNNIIARSMAVTGAALGDPEAVRRMYEIYYEIFGLKGTFIEQYVSFLNRFLTMDFGISILARPATVQEVISYRLPWTVALLVFSTILSWVIGNIIGAVVSLFEGSKLSNILQSLAIILYPIPYYVFALVLIYIFGYIIPLFSLTPIRLPSNIFSLEFIITVFRAMTLPALSIIVIGALGWWFLSSRAMALNIISEDFYLYGEIRGLPKLHLLKKYLLKNILLPQITALSINLGTIFGGALLTEILFNYPGLGTLLYQAVNAGDYPLVLGIVSMSIIGVAVATCIMDLLYPLIDPRIRYR
ncbi:MAG: ABC transporter permease [Nitrososphaerota archaeon]|nr:ABC transporter permease [Nitrososphaerota archaeon]